MLRELIGAITILAGALLLTGSRNHKVQPDPSDASQPYSRKTLSKLAVANARLLLCSEVVPASELEAWVTEASPSRE